MRTMFSKKMLITAAVFLLFQICVDAQAPERFFDEVPAEHANVRLTIFRPSIGTIKAIAALRKHGCLDIQDLVVIGVYHEKEITKYAESWDYVKVNGLHWFHFHQVSAAINEGNLYKINACTPEYEKIFKGSDGIIFFGGPDIPPSIFKEKTSLLTAIEDPFRHEFEISAIFHLLGGFQDETFRGFLETHPEFPVLGICLGCQSLNVGSGGTLIQDIWSEVYGKMNVEDIIALGPQLWHNNPYAHIFPLENLIDYNFHRIRLDGRGKFCRTMGFKETDEPRVLSSHHQALDKLGKGLRIIASSLDGKIIEAVEHEKYPNVLGVQFHPEHTMLWEDEAEFRQTPEDRPFSFKALLEDAPPSFPFNKEIWTWFSLKLKGRHSQPLSEAAFMKR